MSCEHKRACKVKRTEQQLPTQIVHLQHCRSGDETEFGWTNCQ